jgi:hypothetical protein
MLEPELKLAPPADSNRLISKLVVAGVLMVAVGVAVYFLNPRKTAEITVQKAAIFAPHTEFKEMPSRSHVIGSKAAVEDDVYVVATVRVEDKLRLPIFVMAMSASMTTTSGETLEATVISPLDLTRLEESFPQMLPLVNAGGAPPLQFQDEIGAGSARVGTVVLLFPQISEAQWRAKQSATLAVHLLHDGAPVEVSLP